ncbi:hypothetical protein M8J75_004913 [Diaphorina citri]|nr:hypothetical protein M8J75_004913 [Diaphorina citri]
MYSISRHRKSSNITSHNNSIPCRSVVTKQKDFQTQTSSAKSRLSNPSKKTPVTPKRNVSSCSTAVPGTPCSVDLSLLMDKLNQLEIQNQSLLSKVEDMSSALTALDTRWMDKFNQVEIRNQSLERRVEELSGMVQDLSSRLPSGGVPSTSRVQHHIRNQPFPFRRLYIFSDSMGRDLSLLLKKSLPSTCEVLSKECIYSSFSHVPDHLPDLPIPPPRTVVASSPNNTSSSSSNFDFSSDIINVASLDDDLTKSPTGFPIPTLDSTFRLESNFPNNAGTRIT